MASRIGRSSSSADHRQHAMTVDPVTGIAVRLAVNADRKASRSPP
jgi:hypothetical protein